MPKRRIEFFVIDVLIQIEKIKRYTFPYQTAQELMHDEVQLSATLRELEILGEACKM